LSLLLLALLALLALWTLWVGGMLGESMSELKLNSLNPPKL